MQVQRVCHSILPWLISFSLGAKARFMKKRPTSVTVIAWILLVTSALSLLTSTMAINNPIAQELMAKSPNPVPLQYVMLYLGLAISILSAIFMMRAANWARLLYIGWSGIEFLVLL
jgi:hypothetical protein